MDGNSGYLSHSVYPLYFGLARRRASTASRSRGPTGKKQTVPMPVKVNSTIDVKETGA